MSYLLFDKISSCSPLHYPLSTWLWLQIRKDIEDKKIGTELPLTWVFFSSDYYHLTHFEFQELQFNQHQSQKGCQRIQRSKSLIDFHDVSNRQQDQMCCAFKESRTPEKGSIIYWILYFFLGNFCSCTVTYIFYSEISSMKL